ncbi:1506_t:CDS:2 [Entrophospora sp. SA101]|nr:1506_t:CDS:2 [Entrophospora sp. SA101]
MSKTNQSIIDIHCRNSQLTTYVIYKNKLHDIRLFMLDFNGHLELSGNLL